MINQEKTEKQKIIKLRARLDSDKGKVIQALASEPVDAQAIVWQLLAARYLPFVLPQDDAKLRAVAAVSAEYFDGLARAIRTYAGLPQLNSFPVAVSNAVKDDDLVKPETKSVKSNSDNLSALDLTQRKKRQQENLALMDNMLI
jgi:hypothetical protein